MNSPPQKSGPLPGTNANYGTRRSFLPLRLHLSLVGANSFAKGNAVAPLGLEGQTFGLLGE